MSVTIRDVAKAAGVSPSTVSRVLNNKGIISEETCEKIYQAMRELKYVPNDMARSLSRSPSTCPMHRPLPTPSSTGWCSALRRRRIRAAIT